MRLRTRQQYQRMAQETQRFTGEFILANIRTTIHEYSRLGITVTKRYGPSVSRNRFKRIVREAFRLSYKETNVHFDIVIRPRSKATEANRQDIQKEILSFISQI